MEPNPFVVPKATAHDRLSLTIFLMAVLHAAVILGVSFVPESRQVTSSNNIDIVLVTKRDKFDNDDADFLAQNDQKGGGKSDKKLAPKNTAISETQAPEIVEVAAAITLPDTVPEPVPIEDPTEADSAAKLDASAAPPEKVLAVRDEAPQKVLQAEKPEEIKIAKIEESEPQIVQKKKSTKRKNSAQNRAINAAAIIQRSLKEIATRQASIDKKMQAYAKRPRRKWVTASTKRHDFAAYMDAWRRKVERIGNLNYPENARRSNLTGSLLLDVAIKPDGSIYDVVLRRSSGYKLLDDAAIRIVRDASPYSKFPPTIGKQVDILHIERTWIFNPGNRFSSR